MDILINAPEDAKNRSEREMRVYRFLDGLKIKYIRADHEAADTMEKCLEIDKALDVKMCKNLFLCNRQKTNFYLLLMPGDKPYKTKEISSQIGSARLSFGETEYLQKYLDIMPGSVSVLGLINDKAKAVTLLVDKDLLDNEYIGCHPCVNTSSLKIKTADILEVFLPSVDHKPVFVELKGQ